MSNSISIGCAVRLVILADVLVLLEVGGNLALASLGSRTDKMDLWASDCLARMQPMASATDRESEEPSADQSSPLAP